VVIHTVDALHKKF